MASPDQAICARMAAANATGSPRVSVLVERPDHLATLDVQTFGAAEVISWNDGDWHTMLAAIAASHGWSHLRVADSSEAIEQTNAPYVVGWDAYEAHPNALARLIEAADREPAMCGAMAANFDPLILWRRDEFFETTGRKGLAQSEAIAVGGVGGTDVFPPNPAER
jgi:hypothetical protein